MVQTWAFKLMHQRENIVTSVMVRKGLGVEHRQGENNIFLSGCFELGAEANNRPQEVHTENPSAFIFWRQSHHLQLHSAFVVHCRCTTAIWRQRYMEDCHPISTSAPERTAATYKVLRREERSQFEGDSSPGWYRHPLSPRRDRTVGGIQRSHRCKRTLAPAPS